MTSLATDQLFGLVLLGMFIAAGLLVAVIWRVAVATERQRVARAAELESSCFSASNEAEK